MRMSRVTLKELSKNWTPVEVVLKLIDEEEMRIYELEELKFTDNLRKYQHLRKLIQTQIRRERLKKILYTKLKQLSKVKIRKLKEQLRKL